MRLPLIFIFLLSGLASADTKTEVISQLHTYNAFVRHNYRVFGGELLKLSLYSQKEGPAFLQKEEFSNNVGLPVDFHFKQASTGFSVALSQNSDPTVPRRYMVNWYLSKKVTNKIGANFNFYTDKLERDKTFTYSNFNAGLHYQITPKINVNLRSEAGKSLHAAEYNINHVIGTTWTF